MSAVNFDPAGIKNLIFRKNRDGEKVFVFKNTDGTECDISGIDFEFRFKTRSTAGPDILLLTIGSGLSVNVNELTIAITESQSNLPKYQYYWELYNVTSEQTWISGIAYIRTLSTNPDDTTQVTINLDVVDVIVYVGSSSTTSTESPFRGSFNPTGVLLPSSGGSGAGGTIKAGDEWFFSVGETFGGLFYPPDTIVKAKIDTPTQSLNDWRLI